MLIRSSALALLVAVTVYGVACGKKAPPADVPAATAPPAPATSPTADAVAATQEPTADVAVAATDEPTADVAVAPTEAPAADVAAAAEPTLKMEVQGAVTRITGFATPEAVVFVPGKDDEPHHILVSNVAGHPLDKDGDGFISKLAADGSPIARRFVDGSAPDVDLHAPKGMLVHGGLLWVADIDHVRRFDLATGAVQGSTLIPGSTFLNGLAAFGDDILVTDSGLRATADGFEPSGSAAIWKISDFTPEVVLKSEDIGKPNGVYVSSLGDIFWVGFDDEQKLYRYDLEQVSSYPLGVGSLDGLVHLTWNKAGDNAFLLSSWETGEVIDVSVVGGEVSKRVVASGLKGPAAIAYDPMTDVLAIPLFMDHAVELHTLSKPVGMGLPTDPE